MIIQRLHSDRFEDVMHSQKLLGIVVTLVLILLHFNEDECLS